MKLHLESFICDFGVGTEMVTIISTPALESFLDEHNIMWTDFNPDFVNDELNRFIFCTQNKEWAEFVEKFYRRSEVKIVLQEIQTPKDFDIINYYSSNNKVIRYIIFPELRDETFLEQNQKAISDAYLLDKLRNVIANPKGSGINSLNKLKLYWNKITFFEDESPIVTRRQHALKLISKHFSFLYCWLYNNFVRDTKKLSASFKTDFFKSSDILWKQLMAACDRAELSDDNTETELPF